MFKEVSSKKAKYVDGTKLFKIVRGLENDKSFGDT